MKGLMGLQNIPQPVAVTWFAKYPLASFEVTYWKWDDFESNFLAHFSPAPIHPHSPCKMFHRNSLVLRNSARFHFWNSLKREKAIKRQRRLGEGEKVRGGKIVPTSKENFPFHSEHLLGDNNELWKPGNVKTSQIDTSQSGVGNAISCPKVSMTALSQNYFCTF